jgi:predicted dinucleotide-binding enzyme
MFGTGMVGTGLGSALAECGEEVMLGSRTADNPDSIEWAAGAGEGALSGTFADAAAFGELLFNATAGTGSLDALASVAEEDLAGKILIDVANPLDFSGGMPPLLFTGNDDSLGERIQRAHPDLRVVKALNTVTVDLMVDPGRLGDVHDLFICGDDDVAKREVERLLGEWFGWERFIDLGGITNARGTECYLALWIRLYQALGTPMFNMKVVRDDA